MLEYDEYINLAFSTIQEESELDEPCSIVVVWICKTIQNWKGLFYNFTNKRYYEVTYNGDKKEMYLDRYANEKKTVYNIEV
jgi:hypothetical protein